MGAKLSQWSYGKRAGAVLAVIVAAGLFVGLGMAVADDGAAELAAQQESWEAELAASDARADEAEADIASAEERADEAEAAAQRRMEPSSRSARPSSRKRPTSSWQIVRRS